MGNPPDNGVIAMQRLIALATNQSIRIGHNCIIIGLWWDDDNCKWFYIPFKRSNNS